MAKKSGDPPASNSPSRPAEAGFFEHVGKRLDEMPRVQDAEAALWKAKEELEQALARYRDVRASTAADFRDAQQRAGGNWYATAMELVRKYPGAGVVVAGLGGYLLGKIFDRR